MLPATDFRSLRGVYSWGIQKVHERGFFWRDIREWKGGMRNLFG